MGHDVFVSHSSKDKAAADAVCAALESNGIRCWIAPRDIRPGENWAASILRGIADSRMMVLVFSGHANGSKHIRREVERAVHRGIPIAPIRIQDVMPKDDLEYFLSSSHWMDALTPPVEKHLREFSRKVRGLLETDGATPAASPDVSAAVAERTSSAVVAPPRRRTRAPLLVATVCLIGAIAAFWAFRGEIARRWASASGTPPAKDSVSITTPSARPGAAATIPVAGTEFTNSLGMKFKRIEPGAFTMGSPETEKGHDKDEARHEVKLTKAFFMGIHHVTRGQFAAFVTDAGYQTNAEKEGWAVAWTGENWEKVNGASWKVPGFYQTDEHPVVDVSWVDAGAFCEWLSEKEGKHYRLPTEAEWEYSCRAGTKTAYFWGDDPDRGAGFANCADLTLKDTRPSWSYETFNWRDGFAYTSPVGSFKPNAWGLYDMIGNASEWCSDVYGDYPAGAVTDPQGAKPNVLNVKRGGAWDGGPVNCRSARRGGDSLVYRNNYTGFRVVLDSH